MADLEQTESPADRPVAQGPWRAVQQEDGDWEVRAIINKQDHYVLIAFDLTEAVARRMAAAPTMLTALHVALNDLTLNDSAARVVEEAIDEAEEPLTSAMERSE